MVSTEDPELPDAVTFESGAQLLSELNLYPNATGDSIRYIARTREDWPFGEGRSHSYGKASNARTMSAEVLVAYFRENPPAGRGPDKKPRSRKRADE